MWILRWILGAIFLFVAIGFAVLNSSTTVPIDFWLWQTKSALPLWVVIYASFILGMFFWLIISLIKILGLRTETKRAQKEAKDLRAELNKLRNVSIDESNEKNNPNQLEQSNEVS